MTAVEIPAVTCGNAHEQRFETSRMRVTTRVVPALRKQPGTVADTSVEGDDDMDDSRKVHPAIPWRNALLADGSLWPLNTLPSTARLVGCALAEHVGPTGQAFPGAPTLAARTGLSERAVRTNLDVLADAGWLIETDRGGRPGGRRTTLWTIVTPAPRSGVTHAGGSGVIDPTPAPDDTTPEPDALTPAPAAPELEELVEQGREGPGRIDLTSWAAARITRHPDEAGDVMAAAVDRHGEVRVREAMIRLLGRNFAYGSQLGQAIDAVIAKRPARTPLRSVKAPCSECGGSGWTSAPGTNDATRCGCNPDPREVSA